MSPPEAAPGAPSYELTLFVSGASDLSVRAITDARHLCEVALQGRWSLRVVDVRDDPAAALGDEVLVAPTLVRRLPLPVRRLAGDLSDVDRTLRALDIPAVASMPSER